MDLSASCGLPVGARPGHQNLDSVRRMVTLEFDPPEAEEEEDVPDGHDQPRPLRRQRRRQGRLLPRRQKRFSTSTTTGALTGWLAPLRFTHSFLCAPTCSPSPFPARGENPGAGVDQPSSLFTSQNLRAGGSFFFFAEEGGSSSSQNLNKTPNY